MPVLTDIKVAARDVHVGDLLYWSLNGPAAFHDVTHVERKAKYTYITLNDSVTKRVELDQAVAVCRMVETEDEKQAELYNLACRNVLQLVQDAWNSAYDARERLAESIHIGQGTYELRWGACGLVEAEERLNLVAPIFHDLLQGRDGIAAVVRVVEATKREVVSWARRGTSHSTSQWANVVETAQLQARAEWVDNFRVTAYILTYARRHGITGEEVAA